MAYEFKSIADVEVVEKPSDTANVLIEENGIVKKAPKTAVGGADEKTYYIWHTKDSLTATEGLYDAIKTKIFENQEDIHIRVIDNVRENRLSRYDIVSYSSFDNYASFTIEGHGGDFYAVNYSIHKDGTIGFYDGG